MKRYLAAFLISLVCLGSACSVKENVPYNVVLIVSDALRAKQLPCYGYQEIKTPNIDSLATNGVVFDNCYVIRGCTITSFSNLFSGLLFPVTGLLANEKTMAEFFADNDYQTMAVISSTILWSGKIKGEKGKTEFGRGFHRYLQDETMLKKRFFRKNKFTTSDVLGLLGQKKIHKKPFFLFAHYMDPHAPYNPSYNTEIEKIDAEVGKILTKLSDLNLMSNTVVIFMSDHGESLGDPRTDHGSPKGHGWMPYNEQLRIPLIIRFPKHEYTGRVRQIVRNMDLLPTLLDYLGISYEAGDFDGRSLMPAIREKRFLDLSAFVYSTSNRVSPERRYGIIFPFNNQIFKFIRSEYLPLGRELYNISKDPEESNNLIRQKDHQNALKKGIQLVTVPEKQIRTRINLNRMKKKADKEEVKSLVGLGYLAGGAPSPNFRSGWFLLQKQIQPVGELKFHGYARDLKWGHAVRDPSFPISICPADKDLLYILANLNREVYSLTLSNIKPVKITGLENIRDIAWDNTQGLLWILKGKQLSAVTPEANPSLPVFSINLGAEGEKFHSLHIGHDKAVYLVAGSFIKKLTRQGRTIKSFPLGAESSRQIAVDIQGNIFLVNSSRIIKYSRSGHKILTIPAENSSSTITASSIALDKDRQLWILEKNACRVRIYKGTSEVQSFTYNSQPKIIGWKPIPTKQIVVDQDKVIILDNWEGIYIYTLVK